MKLPRFWKEKPTVPVPAPALESDVQSVSAFTISTSDTNTTPIDHTIGTIRVPAFIELETLNNTRNAPEYYHSGHADYDHSCEYPLSFTSAAPPAAPLPQKNNMSERIMRSNRRRLRKNPENPATSRSYYLRAPLGSRTARFEDFVRKRWFVLLIIFLIFLMGFTMIGVFVRHTAQNHKKITQDTVNETMIIEILSPDLFRNHPQIWKVSPEGMPDYKEPLKLLEDSPGHWIVTEKAGRMSNVVIMLIKTGPEKLEFLHYSQAKAERPNPTGFGMRKNSNGKWTFHKTNASVGVEDSQRWHNKDESQHGS